ncbi:MAG: tRNA (adenosine(37)-N6)-threonylcarbamoyltransferase complex ATPase subunit type 1 TsaE [Chitinophagaceae bacterium]|nr:tRNA (adenosine(37)-N6)-threonylcarbamoyltransferase complex ATPase subunit type 1 TsaE [Chitinophagaceae bacterium]
MVVALIRYKGKAYGQAYFTIKHRLYLNKGKYLRNFAGMQWWEYELDLIEETAAEVLAWLQQKNAVVVALQGEMGAGKTTFTAALVKVAGGISAASSPTFSLLNEYATKAGSTIYHMDWYRLHDADEALQAGLEEPLYSGQLCLVEWPQKAKELLPPHTIWLTIEQVSPTQRKIYTN